MPRSRRAAIGVALLAAAACLALLIAGPALLSLYWMRVVTGIFMFATLAQALNVIAGYGGYPAFGNVVFFGLGAYGTGVLMARHGMVFPAALAIGTIFGTSVALVIGPALLRLRGHYCAIGTLALNEALRALAENLTGVTGGGKGLSVPIAPGTAAESSALFYYLFLASMLLSVLVVWLIVRSRFGLALRAVRAGEDAAESLGVDTTRAKTAAWAISAALTALAGGIWAYWISYFDPSGAFDMAIAVKLFVIALLGGMGTLFGPIIGAAVIELITVLAWSNFLEYHTGILGLLIIAVVLFLPGGFADFLQRRVLRRLGRPAPAS